jgi:hypothetical protein
MKRKGVKTGNKLKILTVIGNVENYRFVYKLPMDHVIL